MRKPCARAANESLTPRPSLPMTMAQADVKSTSLNNFSACGMAAYKEIPEANSTSSVTPVTNGIRNTEPAEPRMHFGLNAFTVPFRKINPVAPKASAARMIAPALPGSCTPSSTTTSALPVTIWSSENARGRTSARTPCGVSVEDKSRNTESLTTRASGRSNLSNALSETNTSSITQPALLASSSTCTPSATARPSSVKPPRATALRICLMSGFCGLRISMDTFASAACEETTTSKQHQAATVRERRKYLCTRIRLKAQHNAV